MKNIKRIILALVIVMLCLVPFDVSFADIKYTGTYMFTADGNDNDTDEIQTLINKWFGDNHINHYADLEYLGKLDQGGGLVGEWYWDTPVKYYSVKGGNQYAMYWVDPPQNSGFYSTEHLLNNGGNQPDMSHITFWTNHDVPDQHPTPEPSSWLLSALGLLFISGKKRKI